MKHRNIIARSRSLSLRVLFILSALITVFSPAYAERWKTHPAMDNGPVRIVDTERYTFFQVFQKLYSTTTTTYNEPITAALIYDKKNPDSGIFPMKETFGLNGGSIRTMEYSPEGKFLAILYTDGGLDIVGDSGNVIYNDELKRCSKPGWSVLNSMTLSGTSIWIATPGGYAVFNGKTGETLVLADLEEDIKWIASCGEKIIAFTSDRFYEAPGGNYPRSISEFQSFWVPTSPGHPEMLMPRNDGSFIYLSDKRNTGNYTLNLAIPSDGKWRYRELAGPQLPKPSSDMVISHPHEMNFVRNKEGWVFFTADEIYQLKFDGSPDADDLITKKSIVRKDDPSIGRQVTVAGSWDGTSCWTYLFRGHFSKGELSEGRYLIDDTAPLRPNLPAVAHATHLAYTPEHGTLAINYGYTWCFPAIINNLPPLLSAYKNGVWSLPNPAYWKPRSAEENPDLDLLYTAYYNRFPFHNPTGVIVDPVNRDYAWLGSTFGGMAALSLDDPKADPIHLGSPADPLASYPGFKAILEDVEKWKGYAPLSVPSFDSDGNLWTACQYIDGAVEGDTPARLYYWPRENREKVLASRDVSAVDGIGFMKIPCPAQMNATMRCLATTNPDKRNLVFMFITPYPRYLARLNHKGTLKNQSDDRIDLIYYVEDQHGARWQIEYCYDMKEDPSTGHIWLADKGAFIHFDPAAEVKDGVIKGEVLDVEYEGSQGNPFSYINVFGITFDDSGRLWVTTEGTGVWGISADRKRVEAHYNASNSLLPHDTAYGIVWNSDSKSLMISTREGLVELWPDAPQNISTVPVSVTPREVTPGYMGPVSVRGLAPTERMEIFDRDGIRIAVIESDADGTAHWNLIDSEGKRVKNGFYTLRSSNGAVEIVVMQ